MANAARVAGLLIDRGASRRQARELAERYGLSCLPHPPGEGFYLACRDDLVELRACGADTATAMHVDFTGGRLAHRLRFGGGRRQPLARAVGLKPGYDPYVWDATAGVGRDALVLASLGSRVTLCEREAALAALLDNALQRARLDADLGDLIDTRLQLVWGDSRECLAKLDGDARPDVIYLDPMYPPRKGSARVKKDMQMLQALLHGDTDAGELLDAALTSARRRVVVKRPAYAGFLDDRAPQVSIESKKTRYDIYLITQDAA